MGTPAHKKTVELARQLAEHVARINPSDDYPIDVQELTNSIVTFIESEQWDIDQPWS